MKAQIEISFNKRKVLAFVAGALVFILAGILILNIAMKAKNQVIMQLFLITLGLVSILFFGLIALVLLPKLFTGKPGLIITDEGLWDYSSGVSAGFVSWGDIKKINYSNSGTNTFLVVMVKKPDKFIDRQTNLLKKLAMRMNYKISGSPIHVLVSLLNTDLYTLNDMIAARRYPKNSGAGLE